jgi:hypothetical protein
MEYAIWRKLGILTKIVLNIKIVLHEHNKNKIINGDMELLVITHVVPGCHKRSAL